MSRVLAYSENAAFAREVLTAARELANTLGAEPLLLEFDDGVATMGVGGKVLQVKAQRRFDGDSDLIASAIAEIARKNAAPVILIGATRLGRVVAAKLGVRLGRGVLGEVRGVKVEGETLIGVRGVYSGKFLAKVGAPIPAVATILSGVYEESSGPSSREAVEIQAVSPRVIRVETKPRQRGSVDLKTAKVIVSAGRGVRRKEDLALVDELANALGGVVGCSRPLSSDLGWLGEERHIGMTGIYVHPDLYLAVGISGQLQHIAGIKDSKLIVAINKDRQAPIFQVADYGIVGDLYQVVPALLRALGKPSVGRV